MISNILSSPQKSFELEPWEWHMPLHHCQYKMTCLSDGSSLCVMSNQSNVPILPCYSTAWNMHHTHSIMIVHKTCEETYNISTADSSNLHVLWLVKFLNRSFYNLHSDVVAQRCKLTWRNKAWKSVWESWLKALKMGWK